MMNSMIPILLYHSIAADVAPGYSRWAIHPEMFAVQMAYLQSRCYTPLTVSQFVQALTRTDYHLPERPIIITFDDGLGDFYTGALPVLRECNFAATLYITTGFVGGTSRWLYREGEGGRAMLTWSQITEINHSGIECGAHSHSHLQLDTLSPAAARDEIVRCKTELEQHLGQRVETFAYPHGYYSSFVRQLVQQAGYSSACAVKHAMSAITDDRFALARIMMTNEIEMDCFSQLLAGRGLPIAPRGERLQTKGWRFVRRSTEFLKQHT